MKQPPHDRQLRIAFAYSASSWTGGTHYFKNLFLALRMLDAAKRPEICLLQLNQSDTGASSSLSQYADCLLIPPRLYQVAHLWQRAQVRSMRLLGLQWAPEPPLAGYLRGKQIDAMFAHGEYGLGFNLPVLSWITDFQHMHLPEMFSQDEIKARNMRFARIAAHTSRVILSSRDARKDFVAFAPHAEAKARVLSFAVQVPAEIFQVDPGFVCTTYNLPDKFIYLPNQFWKHKNHGLVLRALALIVGNHPEIVIVCTGNPNDYRNPGYFGQLQATITELGLQNNFVILGMVPHEHLFQLIRQSLAVLQPSLFEGWSTTVEEVKSVGKTMLLSDIPVHREQSPAEAEYFDPHIPQMLADCLIKTYASKEPGPDYRLEEMARVQLPVRLQLFGQTFVDLVSEVVPD